MLDRGQAEHRQQAGTFVLIPRQPADGSSSAGTYFLAVGLHVHFAIGARQSVDRRPTGFA
ncbi:hypothetical protein [Amycolatopsis sp. NPDC102389]|uniref:hypothetical protein n=1 Tax=Amycolatopsis sp. NPDC102389 TaxID=3363941 RepID=UPI0038304674